MKLVQMKKALFTVLLLSLALAQHAEAQTDYVEGLSLRIENYPSVVRPGDEITAVVVVSNLSENRVGGWLRTYVYGFCPDITYPPPEFSDVVLLNEGGWYPNEIWIELDSGEIKTYEPKLKLKQIIIPSSEHGVWVRLRTRLRSIENGRSVNLAPPDTREVLLLPLSPPTALLPIKIFMGVFVGGLLIISAYQTRNSFKPELRRKQRKKRFGRNRQGSRARP